MNEKPIERLNYFNGQRLQASDLKTEQDYHVRVRRWLNRSLYTAGIASGLGVRKVPGAPRVRIDPGLALDSAGREIILVDEREETVPGSHDETNKPIALYLTIRYSEDVFARQDACCTPESRPDRKIAWGAPSRVLAAPVLEWSRDLPHEDSGKVLLAYVGLGQGCKDVNVLDLGVRRYVGAAAAAKVKQYALEGVRDIDRRNLARILFHIRGRQPNSITLYLKAEKLPSLYYTEMGHHTHPVGVNGNLTIPAHSHGGATVSAGGHTPTVSGVVANADASVWDGVVGLMAAAATAAAVAGAGVDPAADAFAAIVDAAALGKFIDDNVNPDREFMNLTLSPHAFRSRNNQQLVGGKAVNMRVTLNAVPGHTHTIPQQPAQTLAIAGQGTSSPAGVDDLGPAFEARSGDPLTYVRGLKLEVDGINCTADALRQIVNNRPPNEDWTRLGDGTANHPLVMNGSGAIRLDFLPGVVLGEGEHVIELSVAGDANGGRIHFNLYVE